MTELAASYLATAFLQGSLAELIVYNGILSAADRTTVTKYLGTRYAKVIS